jgi:hypothetical protein
MTVSKIGRTRRKPVKSGALRARMRQTLARNVAHLCEDAQQRGLFRCLNTDGVTIATCFARYRSGSDPESYHALATDARLCRACRADVALHLAATRLRELAG